MSKYLNNVIISNLAIFLFIIAGNYVGDIYSCSLRKLFNDHMILKHVIGYFILLFFVGLVQKDLLMNEKIISSFVLYIFFILIMRAPYYITLISITLICIMYIINLHIEDLEKLNNKDNIDFYKVINNYIFIGVLLICILGLIYFIIKMKLKFKKKFSIYKFLIGIKDQDCYVKNIPIKLKKKM